MSLPIKVIDLEISNLPSEIRGLNNYSYIKALLRLYDKPICSLTLPIQNGECQVKKIISDNLEKFHFKVLKSLVGFQLLKATNTEDIELVNLLSTKPMEVNNNPNQPKISVAVCTRNRAENLSPCLDSIATLNYSNYEVLVIDNAPKDEKTKKLLAEKYNNIRYINEPIPGLDWARNRAIQECSGEIIAFTDDDVIVDKEWLNAICEVFINNSEVMAVTGLVIPHELETESQILFEEYGGFGRGFERKWHHKNDLKYRKRNYFIGSGAFGTGANMSFRRQIFEQIGYFDPALDVGTVTNGGGDLEMFFRVIQEGYLLVYEPAAIVRHYHRREYAKLKEQITNNGIGFYSFLVRSFIAYPSMRLAILRFGLWWFRWWHIRRLFKSLINPSFFPLDLILAELKGSFIGLFRYFKARVETKKLLHQNVENEEKSIYEKYFEVKKNTKNQKTANSIAIREMQLGQGIQEIKDLSNYKKVKLYLHFNRHLIGCVDIANYYNLLGRDHVLDEIVNHFTLKLVEFCNNSDQQDIWGKLKYELYRCFFQGTKNPKKSLSPRFISVVLPTYDRPDDLNACLESLISQKTSHMVEIIVIDNNPQSGLTKKIVSNFSGVKYITEIRKGLSYARNKGIRDSHGDIIVAVDDDVIMPKDWLEKLIAAFSESNIAAVTGNVLPYELETEAQILFEEYGGLGKGFKSITVDRSWFKKFKYRAVETWKLGATANAAFRADIFHHPDIGLLDESLGAGTPTGCSEDTYLFYKILDAGLSIKYEPEAFVWHKHRRKIKELRNQIYNYSKGHVAYHLLTLFKHSDVRVIFYLFFFLPRVHLWQIKNRLIWRNSYPLKLIFVEIIGNLMGPISLLRSRLRMRRLENKTVTNI